MQGRELSERFAPDALGMYALTLACEAPVILSRCLLASIFTPTLLTISNHWIARNLGWIEAGLLPTLWSALALVTPAGTGWWWRQRCGGREPSQRERSAYGDAVELLRSHARERLALPKSLFVLDTPVPEAAVRGETLMLSRGLLESEHLAAVLAHELGHLASADGRLTAAVGRLMPVAPRGPSREEGGRRPVARPLKAVLLWLGGGFGLWLTGPLWGAYWRRREYRADAFAAALGQGADLAEFLESHALFHDQPVPHRWLSGRVYPPVELRIERLCGQAGG